MKLTCNHKVLLNEWMYGNGNITLGEEVAVLVL